MGYFSARLLVVCFVDGLKEDKHTCDHPFVLFRAEDKDDAFSKALALGRKQECTYKNSDGQDVQWVLVAVEQIWDLGEEIDGVEVGSILDTWSPDGPISKDLDFKPEDSLPMFNEVGW